MLGPTFENRFVKLDLQRARIVGGRPQWSEKTRSAAQIALRLRNLRFRSQGIDVARNDIENLIELSQRFGKTAETSIVRGETAKQGNIARIEPLRFEQVKLTPFPLTSPPLEVADRLRDAAAIWKKLAGFQSLFDG